MKTTKFFKSGLLFGLGCLATFTYFSFEDKSSVPPEGMISIDEIVHHKQEFLNNIAPLMDKRYNSTENGAVLSYDDDQYIPTTTSVTYSIDRMKDYIAYIEKQANKSGVDVKGIRMHLMQYSADEEGQISGKPKANRLSVFFAPTTDFVMTDGEIRELSFVNTEKNGLNSATPFYKAYKLKESYDNITSLSMNLGTLMPPPPVNECEDDPEFCDEMIERLASLD